MALWEKTGNCMKDRENISVIGLGKLGLPLAAAIASRGYQVLGYDSSTETRSILREGRCPIEETDLPELLKVAGPRLRIADEYSTIVQETRLSFVIVPTPSQTNGSFSLQYVEDVLSKLGEALRPVSEYHLVVLCSTVNPGDFDLRLKGLLEKASQKKIGRDLGYCYNPQFIALGSVVQDILYPDFALVGQSDADAGAVLTRFLEDLLGKNRLIQTSSVAEAELAKVAINALVTAKISFGNFLGSLCEKLPGANADKVTQIVGSDSRIGKKYLKAGTSFGGPCFPRDNQALSAFAKRVHLDAALPNAVIKTNEGENKRLLEKVIQATQSPQDRIGILGLSYKPKTAITDSSTGIYLQKELQRLAYKVSVFDPLRKIDLNDPKDLIECVTTCDVLVVTTPCPEFETVPSLIFSAQGAKPHTVIDCWRLYKNATWSGSSTCRYLPMGVGIK